MVLGWQEKPITNLFLLIKSSPIICMSDLVSSMPATAQLYHDSCTATGCSGKQEPFKAEHTLTTNKNLIIDCLLYFMYKVLYEQ